MRNHDLPDVVGAQGAGAHGSTPLQGPLPEGWGVASLGSLGEVSAGGSAPQGTKYFGGNKPFVRVQHLEEDGYQVPRWDLITDDAVRKYRLRLYPAGTIVFPKSGASIRLEKRAVLRRPSYLVSHLCALIPNRDVVDGDFLFFALRAIRFASEKAEGYPTLSLSEIRARLLLLPPLPEQRAIAQVLRTVQRAKEATERVIAAARELKKSLMRHLFTYGPVPLDQVDGVRLNETEIGPVPEHWEVVRLGELAQFERGVSWSKNDESNVGVGVLSIPNIGSDGQISPRPRVSIRKTVPEHKILKSGDILLVGSSGSLSNVGRYGIFLESTSSPLTFASFTIRVRSNELDLFQSFLPYLMLSSWVPFSAFSKRAADGKYNLQVQQLRHHIIPLPPLPEQRAIAEMLRAVDRKIQAEERRKAALDALFRTLLHHLMTGKVRVRGVLTESEE